MKTATVTKHLAAALAALAKNGQKVDDLAGSILKLSREFKNQRGFSKAVRGAYAANGWHSGRGRPRKEAGDLQPVPATVKTYVWEVRRALAAGLRVWNYSTFYELRRAMAARQLQASQQHRAVAPKDPELSGVRITSPGTFTGHLMHDLVVVMDKLGTDRREHLQRGLERLLKQYAPARARQAFERKHTEAQEAAEERKAA